MHSFTLPTRHYKSCICTHVVRACIRDAMRCDAAHADARVGAPRAMSNAVKKGIDKVRLMYARRRRE